MAEASSTDRDSDGSWEENSIISEGFSDYSDSSSSSSSSSDISDDEVNNQEVEIVRGAEPYRFEPLAANRGAEAGEGRDVPGPEQPANDRLLNIHWCSCGKCVPMEDVVNCFCCKECPEIQAKVEETREFVEFEEGRCFTDHPYYHGTCLNPGTLQTVYYLYRQHYGRRAVEGTREQKYRHMSYRQIVRWCWGFLGKYNRVPLPSCVMNMARTTYPDPQGEYVGFKYPPLDD